MEHADTAQIAAVGGALGSALVLLARGRLPLLAGLVLLALAEAGMALAFAGGGGLIDALGSAAAVVAAVAGIALLCAAALFLARRPAFVPLAVLAAAPLRPPIEFDSFQPLPDRDRPGRPAGPPAAALLRAGGCGARARLARAQGRGAAAAAPRHRPPRRGVLRVRVPVAPVGRQRQGRRGPPRLVHAAVRGAAGHGGAGRISRTGCRGRSASWAWASPRCSPRWACGRPPRTSSSSTRPTSRSRTPTPRTSGSPRCSATRASTGATWCSGWPWCCRCSPPAGCARARRSR